MDSEKPPRAQRPVFSDWLTGQLLVAMPNMPDPRFTHAVIYICSHGPNGAMGLVLNQLFGEASFTSLLQQLNINTTPETPDLPLYFGGPVEPGRGFILHSSDYVREGTTRIDDNISLSATIEILQSLAKDEGPQRAIMMLGYSSWGAGQLDAEMKANGWLTVPADDALLFDPHLDTKWARSLAKIGIIPAMLSGEAGHA